MTTGQFKSIHAAIVRAAAPSSHSRPLLECLRWCHCVWRYNSPFMNRASLMPGRFSGNRSDILYVVKTSSDLINWDTTGDFVSNPDINAGPQCFYFGFQVHMRFANRKTCMCVCACRNPGLAAADHKKNKKFPHWHAFRFSGGGKVTRKRSAAH